jgi:hypothetical protein
MLNNKTEINLCLKKKEKNEQTQTSLLNLD